MNIPHQRLQSQGIAGSPFLTPEAAVQWLGAVQAQDYLASLWAVGLRVARATEGSVEEALAAGRIVRTWPLRGTLHLVAAEDVRWMLGLLAPRVLAANAKRLERQYGLDDKVIGRAREVVLRSLEGGRQLKREALYQALEEGGLASSAQRGLHVVWWLAHEGVLCFGPRQGKQQTFVLLDDWVPAAEPLDREEALARLARRYFASRGPATARDFAWWAGLPLSQAAEGVVLIRPELDEERIEGELFWRLPAASDPKEPPSSAHLLPAFDEYVLAYQDRSAVLASEEVRRVFTTNGIFNPVMVLDGQVIGTWKRTLGKKVVSVALAPFGPMKRADRAAFESSAGRYGDFQGVLVAME